eukprot:PhF_6_TR30593/c0_g1_i2/m.45023
MKGTHMDHGASLLRCKSCTHPHPVNGGLCPHSGCPSCGSTSHSDSSLCEDATATVPSTKSNEVKFDSKQFEQEFPRPESADAAFQLLKSGYYCRHSRTTQSPVFRRKSMKLFEPRIASILPGSHNGRRKITISIY